MLEQQQEQHGCAGTRTFDTAAGRLTLDTMLDKVFSDWWVARVQPYRDVVPEKLAAERETEKKQQEYNRHYADFLNHAVLPAVEELVEFLKRQHVVFHVTSWGNQLAVRIHLTWRWGELVIMQSHEDCVTFEHHIITEGERRGEDSADDHTHTYDLRDPIPGIVADQELAFFLSRLVQDLVEDEEPDGPPGEEQ